MQDNSPSSRRVRPCAAAEHANLSESFLAKLRMTGAGPRFIKVGKAVLYDCRATIRMRAARQSR